MYPPATYLRRHPNADIALEAPGVIGRSSTCRYNLRLGQGWGDWSEVDTHARVIVSISSLKQHRGGNPTSTLTS